jgi:hypothetical protein
VQAPIDDLVSVLAPKRSHCLGDDDGAGRRADEGGSDRSLGDLDGAALIAVDGGSIAVGGEVEDGLVGWC